MAFMSAAFICDVCHTSAEAKTTHMPPLGWFLIELSGPGIGIGGKRAHACSKVCASSMLSAEGLHTLMPAATDAA